MALAIHPPFRDVVAGAARLHGHLSDGGHRLAWAELGEAVASVERTLVTHDLDPFVPVVLEGPTTVPGALALLALLARGTTVVLVPPPLPSVPAPPLPRFAAHRVRIVPGTAPGLDFAESVAIEALASHRPLPPDSPLRAERIVLRTSGSVDRPKLVTHTQRGLLANAANVVERLRLQASDRVLIPVPLAHMYGLGAGLLPSLAAGASIDLLDGANLLRYLERERSVRPTVAFFTPNLCITLLRPRAAAEGYRHVVVAGDSLGATPFARAEEIFRRVVNLYGSTELGAICAADPDEELDASLRAITVGRPLPGVELRLAEPPREGEGTELLCAHPHGLERYVDEEGLAVGEPAATWFPTRDLARLHPDGSVEVLGRIDHAVKRDGRLVMLAGVEQALERQAGVDRAAAIVAGQTPRGRGIVAFCSPREGAELEPGRLRRLCQDVLPPYAVPDEIHLLPALPVLPSGKLDRKALHRNLPGGAS